MLKMISLSLLLVLSVYLFASFRFISSEDVEIEIKLLDQDQSLKPDEFLIIDYASNLPIPYYNTHIERSFVFDKIVSDPVSVKIKIKDVVDSTDSKKALVKIPKKLRGLGDYRLSSIRFERLEAYAIFGDCAPLDHLKNDYSVYEEGVSDIPERKPTVVFRSLSKNLCFLGTPDGDKYFVDEGGQFIQNPFYEWPIVTLFFNAQKMQKSTPGKNVTAKVQKHQFSNFAVKVPDEALLWNDPQNEIQTIELNLKSKTDRGYSKASFYFTKKSMLAAYLEVHDDFGAIVESALYGFSQDKLVYANSPSGIWSSLYEIDGSSDPSRLKPTVQSVDELDKDFIYLKSFLN
jgi:hypothetical protein